MCKWIEYLCLCNQWSKAARVKRTGFAYMYFVHQNESGIDDVR